MAISPIAYATLNHQHKLHSPSSQSRQSNKSQRLSSDTRVALLRRVVRDATEKARRLEMATDDRMQVDNPRIPLSPVGFARFPTSQIAAFDTKYTLDAYKHWSATKKVPARQQPARLEVEVEKKDRNYTTALRSPALKSPGPDNIAILTRRGRRNALAHSPTKAELARLFAPQAIAAPRAFVLEPVPASRRRRSLSPPLTTIAEELPARRESFHSLQYQQREATKALNRSLPPLSTLHQLLAADLESRKGGVKMVREAFVPLQMRGGELSQRRGREVARLVMFGNQV